MRFALFALASTTALISVAHANTTSELAALANFSLGSSGQSAAWTLAPEYSDDLGFSLGGSVGVKLSEREALGLVLKAGDNTTEFLLNIGLAVGDNGQLVASAGQLRERLSFGDAGEREWVAQDEFGLSYTQKSFTLNAYKTKSETTDNFVGAESYGIEAESKLELSDSASVLANLGYQTLEWNDGESDGGVTGRLELTTRTSDTLTLSAFGDYNLSETQYGLKANWALGAATVAASYARIDGRAGQVQDDERIALSVTLPLGNTGANADTYQPVNTLLAVNPSMSPLLQKVMERPSFLPSRVIVKEAGSGSTDCIALAAGVVTYDGSGLTVDYDIDPAEGLQAPAPAITKASLTGATIDVLGGSVAQTGFTTQPAGPEGAAGSYSWATFGPFDPGSEVVFGGTVNLTGGGCATFELNLDD